MLGSEDSRVELAQVKELLNGIEHALPEALFVELYPFERDDRTLHVALTERLRKAARKMGVWRSREMLATLKNASYGFHANQSRTVGGRDGIFVIDRGFRPPNEMMHKLFDQYLDKPGSGAEEVATALGVSFSDLIPVRLVSHHMRLLGVLARLSGDDWLVLVDCDRSD